MSKPEYQLIESLGLGIYENSEYTSKCGTMGCRLDAVNADDLERVLENAPIAYGIGTKECGSVIYGDSVSPNAKWEITARLLCIQPIAKPDTAEDLLRSLVLYIDNEGPAAKEWQAITDLVDRAKRLLEGK